MTNTDVVKLYKGRFYYGKVKIYFLYGGYLMDIYELETPSFLVDVLRLYENIEEVQKLCNENNKELWPMTKTHKSTEIAKIQEKAGAKGFLVGTIDEMELLIRSGIKNIMYPYPVAGIENIRRIIKLIDKANIFISVDNIEQVDIIDKCLKEVNKRVKALVIINSGLNRFGISPEELNNFIVKSKDYLNVDIVGVGTHPGQVYAAKSLEDIEYVAKKEDDVIRLVREELSNSKENLEIFASGSTPSFFYNVGSENINIFRPGNYVFYDNIQVANGLVKEDKCALTILATVISKRDGYILLDAGSKCLGLDKGAHGISNIDGYGKIKEHEELVITELSEEVAKVKVIKKTNLKVGDKVRIIPNHSCFAANCTSYLVAHKNKKVIGQIKVDMRGGSMNKLCEQCE